MVSAFPEWVAQQVSRLAHHRPACPELPTAPVLFEAMNRITELRLMCSTEITAEFDPVEALFVPGFREDFHAWWDAA